MYPRLSSINYACASSDACKVSSTERRRRRQPATLALYGWVRNCREGGVELVVEGPVADCEPLLEHCRRGPPPTEPATHSRWAAKAVWGSRIRADMRQRSLACQYCDNVI